MPPMMMRRTAYMYLKDLNIFGNSLKKFDFSASFDVAPHCMSMEHRCAIIAPERWNDRPPKKSENMGIHLKFSQREAIRPFSPRRYRKTARETGPRMLKTTIKETKTKMRC
jgi:hypothetical protein